MRPSLALAIGQYSERGRKPANQDFHGALIPSQPLLDLKGVAVALADGISTSAVGAEAAQTAVRSFLTDYYATPEAWPVKTAAHRVIAAANAWLHAQTRSRSAEPDQGYVCTLSALVLRARGAHVFHVGDSRIYRLAGGTLEQLTEDHRLADGPGRAYLGRALGAAAHVKIDYRRLPLALGDTFVLTTDGIHDHVDGPDLAAALGRHRGDLDAAAAEIAAVALQRGSHDNLTVQIVRVDGLPDGEADDAALGSEHLPLPPPLEPRLTLDGYRILRPLHLSARSHVYLAEDEADGSLVAIKAPSAESAADPAYLRRFALEDWIARRISSPHVLRPPLRERPRSCLYLATEYVEGDTLAQWMRDHPHPELAQVRDLIEQIARGLRAFHRLEMVHGDLRPENIIIDRSGTARIIDFGSTRVAGLRDAAAPAVEQPLGTLQYSAPETLLGDPAGERCDIFSLGVIAYQMLTGVLPYGAGVARLQGRAGLSRLRYVPARDSGADIPAWVDRALQKAVHPDPEQRYEVLSEFTYDLRHPNPDFALPPTRPLVERNPLRFWQFACLALAAANLLLLAYFLR